MNNSPRPPSIPPASGGEAKFIGDQGQTRISPASGGEAKFIGDQGQTSTSPASGGEETGGRLRLCLIPGDGIGLEVIPAAVGVLRATGLAFETVYAEAGWACFHRHGTALPAKTIETAKHSDAILFGAVSSPSFRVEGYSSPIVALRRELDLFANLRPSHSWPVATSRPGIDLLLVRENSEGLYVKRERREGDGAFTRAIAERVITRQGSERVVCVACEWAMRRRRQLTVVHKANVLPETCGLFREAALSVAAGYPDLTVQEMLVDTAALRLVTHPEAFDVLVTTNLFGDILSDEAAGLVGGLGLAPSANVGMDKSPALFEPVHGSAPDIAGQGIANPVAAILAAAMLLDHLGETERARRVRDAVEHTLRHGPHTPDLGGTATTAQVTEAIKVRIANSNVERCKPMELIGHGGKSVRRPQCPADEEKPSPPTRVRFNLGANAN